MVDMSIKVPEIQGPGIAMALTSAFSIWVTGEVAKAKVGDIVIISFIIVSILCIIGVVTIEWIHRNSIQHN
ncbi:MAG: hypothetical protein C3F06_04635 [Candidatus Methanoperedenaceae archaeon]|nr:MAG: hypothetical protein C3F06_04635 [Candidatus Methanoperedenaceae archaeon]